MDFAWIIARVQNILLRPKDEWYVVDGEEGSPREVFTYAGVLVAILAVVSLLVLVIRHVTIAPYFLTVGSVIVTILYPLVAIGFLYVSAFIVDFLAPHFDTEKHMPSALKLVSYSITPSIVASTAGSILGLLPAVGGILALLLALAGLAYYIYIFYFGILILMRAPLNKAIGYTAASLGIMFATAFVFALILGAILYAR